MRRPRSPLSRPAVGALLVAALLSACGASSATAPTVPAPTDSLSATSPAPSSGVLPVIDPAPAWTAGRGIWVVGDSLTVQTSEPLGVALTLAGWHLQGIDAVNGRKTPVAMARAETLFSVLPAPPVVLVATGTNDYETPYSEQTQRIGAFVNWLLAHGARQIYWVDAHRVGDEEVNRALRDVAATAPTTLHVIAWNDAATQHPSWIVADGVHLTEEGRSGRVSVIMSALPDPLSVPAQ